MPYVYRTKNKKTGKYHPLYRYTYYTHDGRKKSATGTPSRRETEKIAAQVQGREYAIRNRVASPPKASDVARSIEQVIAEYLQWGNTVGGRRGRPWSREHARKREQNLEFWRKELKLRTQHDLVDCQRRVERVIHRMHIDDGRSGKTVWNRVETLAAFGRWCVDRDYLDRDPLRRLKRINTDPVKRRRPLVPDEIDKLVTHCLPERRLLYRTAICTGLRANELAHVTPAHLDTFRCGIRLEAAWTKNRQSGFQVAPRWLMDELMEAGKGMPPDAPMFFIQKAHASRMLQDDLERAEIAVFKPGEGKVVFHSLRMTYLSLLDWNGASAKECQELARHSTPIVTMNSYVRTREDRVRSVVEAIGEALKPDVTSKHNPNGDLGQETRMRKAL